MTRDESIPYPRPDYKDGELDSKEMINGTLTMAIFDDLNNFRPVFNRYNVTQSKLTDMTSVRASGGVSPEDVDITMTDPSRYGIQEIAFLPAKRPIIDPQPEVVYDPRRHYDNVVFMDAQYIDLDTPEIDNMTVNIPYYDKDDAGLFGYIEHKDENDEVIGRQILFWSLVSDVMHTLAHIPMSLDWDTKYYVGYVKGGLVWRFGQGLSYQYLIFKRGGGYTQINATSSNSVAFGDEGVFAIESNTKTFVYNLDGSVEDELDGLFCAVDPFMFVATGFKRYPFGVRIDDTFFYAKNNEKSYKWEKRKKGWRAKIIDFTLWKYQKKVLFDYMTAGWLEKPIKALHFNQRKHGIFTTQRMAFTKKNVYDASFQGSDSHGDFVMMGSGSSRELKHTYNFSIWTTVAGNAKHSFHASWDRIWVKGRADGVVGYQPSIMQINNFQDSVKMLFRGFVFRKTTI